MTSPGARRGNLVLIGFMGSGKTTVGRALAAITGRRFVDLDRLVVRRAGATVARLFRERGERAFRRLEAAAVRALHGRGGLVIAAGGGAPVWPETRRALRRAGVVIWLRVPAAELVRRLRRGA